jgi:IS30 family transposase
MRRMRGFLRRSPTCDRGLKMASYPKLARRLKIDIRFRDLHAPRQRGSNGTTNAPRRKFLPEGRGPLRLVPA